MKHPNTIKAEAVLFYERGHTFAETKAKYGMSESTFYEWKKKFDLEYPNPENIRGNRSASRKAQLHLEKLSLELEVLRQCSCGINASVDEKMAAIAALGNKYSIHVLCDALGLPRGTYYNRKRREGTLTSYDMSDIAIKPLVEKIFLESKCRFGRKPIHRKLSEMGYHVSEKRIASLMKEMGLVVSKPAYKAEHQKPLPRAYFKNLLTRQFDQAEPNLVWVSDITYVKVGEQYHYVCVILDLFSRRVLSYRISDTIDTSLSLSTFEDAFHFRKPENLIFHSDQGVQYTAYVFRQS